MLVVVVKIYGKSGWKLDCDATWDKLFTAIDSALPSASTSTGIHSQLNM